jgi:cellulose biosynthesis protein BcsQ
VDLDGQANSSRTFGETFTGLLASKLFTAEPGTLTEVPQAVSKHLTLIPADVAINDVEGLDLATIERNGRPRTCATWRWPPRPCASSTRHRPWAGGSWRP